MKNIVINSVKYENDVLDVLNDLVKIFGTRMSKERLAGKMYSVLSCWGVDVVILNEKYLMIDDNKYQFIKRKTGWEVKEW